MSDLKMQNNPDEVGTQPQNLAQAEESPDSLLQRSLDKIQSSVKRAEQLDSTLSKIGQTQKTSKSREQSRKKPPKKKATDKAELNWAYFMKGYRKASILARTSMYRAVEFLRELRKDMFEYTNPKRHRKQIQATLAQIYLFFTL